MGAIKKNFFRQEALQKLETPDQLDQTLEITSSANWLIILGLILISVAFIIWGIFGTISTQVFGQGILIRQEGIHQLLAPWDGELKALFVETNDLVQAGDLIGEIVNAQNEVIPLYSPFNGRITELFFYQRDYVLAGQRILNLEIWRGQNEELLALLFLPAEEGQKLQQGMTVRISPFVFPREEYGYLLGEIISVADYPSSVASISRLLGNEDLARKMIEDFVPIQVRVQLYTADTPSGYQWTSGKGPSTAIKSGTLFEGRISIREQRPFSLFFSWAAINFKPLDI